MPSHVINIITANRVSLGCLYLRTASPEMLSVALHGAARLPVAVQVKLNTPPDNVVVFVVDTTTPLLSVQV